MKAYFAYLTAAYLFIWLNTVLLILPYLQALAGSDAHFLTSGNLTDFLSIDLVII